MLSPLLGAPPRSGSVCIALLPVQLLRMYPHLQLVVAPARTDCLVHPSDLLYLAPGTSLLHLAEEAGHRGGKSAVFVPILTAISMDKKSWTSRTYLLGPGRQSTCSDTSQGNRPAFGHSYSTHQYL